MAKQGKHIFQHITNSESHLLMLSLMRIFPCELQLGGGL